eukprot:1837421-Pyramimonas_sp.AAC.1
MAMRRKNPGSPVSRRICPGGTLRQPLMRKTAIRANPHLAYRLPAQLVARGAGWKEPKYTDDYIGGRSSRQVLFRRRAELDAHR